MDVEVVSKGWNPTKLVEHATALIQKDKKDAKQSRDLENVYNDVWVLTDVDDFGAEIPAALRLASSEGVQLAVSNPCFEAWLVMHHDSSSASLSSAQAQAKAKSLGMLGGSNNKSIVPARLVGRFAFAESTAKLLRTGHESAGTEFPHDSPSTQMHVLVRSLITYTENSSPGKAILL